ncbi:hypothetical protein Q1695_004063 [Nippostrongylus brasiliensis]|nr:hypothetical protein Q1695_004063 [Nippostrongylus brasiliensis]
MFGEIKYFLIGSAAVLLIFHIDIIFSTLSISKRFELHNYSPPKYVGLHLNAGRLGNQLFHLISGYGIARTLGRIHYLPCEETRTYVLNFLKPVLETFPNLDHTYVVPQNVTNETIVPFSRTCCDYVNPERFLNHPSQYLLLDFSFAQNPRYFDNYLDDVRRILTFSSKAKTEGERNIQIMNVSHNSALCIHIRRGDFVGFNVSSDFDRTVGAAYIIAKQMSIDRFVIFGDDREFMRNVGKAITKKGKWCEQAAYVSGFDNRADLYLSSQLCRSFLITAPTSSYGWWMAFFAQNQDSIFYILDDRSIGTKKPRKDLFLKTWRQI